MNEQKPAIVKPNVVQVIAVIAAGAIAWMLAWALMWCAMFKIYIDVPQLMAISNILSGIGGALTTILVGRSISQLNQAETQTPIRSEQTTITQQQHEKTDTNNN